jgi:hypothetical protein
MGLFCFGFFVMNYIDPVPAAMFFLLGLVMTIFSLVFIFMD